MIPQEKIFFIKLPVSWMPFCSTKISPLLKAVLMFEKKILFTINESGYKKFDWNYF